MNTLIDTPFADLLQRLFVEAEASAPGGSPTLAGLSEAELKHLIGSKVEYHGLYGHLKDPVLPASRETGSLLYMLVRSSSAHSIVELGISLGLSILYLVTALRDNGDGRLISGEFRPSKAERTQCSLATGGLLSLMEPRKDDTLQILAKDLPGSIDLVLPDGAKTLYLEVLALLESRLRPGALVITDSVEHSPEYLAHVRSPTNGYLLTPFIGDIKLSMHLD